MAGKKTPLTPRQALDKIEHRREQQRALNVINRQRVAAAGLVLAQVRIPADARGILSAVAAALVNGSYDAREKVVDQLLQYSPAMRTQDSLLDL